TRSDTRAFSGDVEPVRDQSGYGLHAAAWPADGQPIHLPHSAESEMHADVVLRQVAAATPDFSGLSHTGDLRRDACANRIAVADCALEPHGDPLSTGRVVAQERWTIVHVHDEHVDVAVVVVVAERRSAA